jgi:glycosidase
MNAGFSNEIPWLPVTPDYSERNVDAESNDPDSILNLYRKLISLRNNTATLQSGDWVPVIKGEKGILAYYRILRNDKILVLLNFRRRSGKISLPVPVIGNVLISTHRQAGIMLQSEEDEIYPYEATVVRLRS